VGTCMVAMEEMTEMTAALVQGPWCEGLFSSDTQTNDYLDGIRHLCDGRGYLD